MADRPPHVALLVTCLVDLFRPQVGFAAVKLLQQAGCRVEVPPQTCCGQPAFNSGAKAAAKRIAKQAIVAFERFDYVVAPSGSCAGMLAMHYPELFDDDPPWATRARALARKTYELVQFLTDVRKLERVEARYAGRVTYHDSCSGLRELKVKQQPRKLLASVEGLSLAELPGAEICCGFGGTFCVKYGEISTDMVERKCADIAATGADTLLAGDLGCLMNMAGRLSRRGSAVKVRHVAEVLADATAEAPPIGANAPEGHR